MPGHIYKRGEIYWIKFSQRGENYYASSKSIKKEDATRLLSMYLGEIAAGTFRGLKKDRPVFLLSELLDDFEADCTDRKLSGVNRIVSHLKPIRAFFKDAGIEDITALEIERYKKHRRRAKKRDGTSPISDAKINRELQYLLQALRLAQERDLIERLPKVKKYRETNVRQGFFSKEDFDRLVSFLPEDIQDFVRFGYYSGWRKGEISRFEWRDVHDTVSRLRPEVSKNKDGRVLALVGEIGEIIQRRRALTDETVPYVFHRNGRQVKDFRKAWRTACRKADIPIRDLQLGVKDGRVFHDLRRTTARNLNRAGVPDRIAMGLMGHKTRAMYDRYNIVDEEDIRRSMQQMERYLAKAGDNPVTENPKG